MPNFYIYVFRHGQTYYNLHKIHCGWKDSQLTPLGRRQAAIIARQLKNKKIELAFTSHLSRAKETLKIVLKNHPECRKVVTDDRIIERNYGRLSGIKHETLKKKYGVDQWNRWHRSFDVRPPGGESLADVEKRVRPFLRDLESIVKKERANVALSAHGNSIRLMRKILEKKTKKEAEKWTIPYDRYFKYTVKGK